MASANLQTSLGGWVDVEDRWGRQKMSQMLATACPGTESETWGVVWIGGRWTKGRKI